MTRPTSLCILLVFTSTCSGTFQSDSKPQFHDSLTEKGEAWCEMCVLAMDQLSVIIKEKDSQGQINATLYSLCDMVKGYMRQQCYAMIPIIEQQIKQGFNPEKACVLLQFCGGGLAPSMVMSFVSNWHANRDNMWSDAGHILKQVVPHVESTFNQFRQANSTFKEMISVTCLLCKAGVSLIDRSLDKFKQPLVDYVVGICSNLPSPTNQACADAMKYYIPFWWDQIFDGILSGDDLCFKLRLCDEASSVNVNYNTATK